MTDGTKIKLVAMDLDGTLLDSQKRVPEGFFDMARDLHSRGIHIVIASGRQYYNILTKFGDCQDDLVFMADNGALFCIYGEIVLSRNFTSEQVERVLRAASAIPTVLPVVCCADCAYSPKCRHQSEMDDIALYYARVKHSDELFEKARRDKVIKIALHDLENSTKNILPVLSPLDGDEMCVRVSADIWLDVMPAGVDKGDGIRFLQQRLGISPDECMAFGDFDNDLGLLSACTESYAMANAVPQVKAISKYEAPSNDDDGVMKVLRRVFCK